VTAAEEQALLDGLGELSVLRLQLVRLKLVAELALLRVLFGYRERRIKHWRRLAYKRGWRPERSRPYRVELRARPGVRVPRSRRSRSRARARAPARPDDDPDLDTPKAAA
jgi:hypothetical protein